MRKLSNNLTDTPINKFYNPIKRLARLQKGCSLKQTCRPFTMNWEVTIAEFEDKEGKKYKVTRRMPEMQIAETKIFKSKQEARKQYEEWLQ